MTRMATIPASPIIAYNRRWSTSLRTWAYSQRVCNSVWCRRVSRPTRPRRHRRSSFPSHGDLLLPGQPVNILNSLFGTATDVDGRVAAVEVSVDGGLTWHPADGRESWSYSWTPSGNGLVTILSRAVDDSGNLEIPSAGIDVIVGEAAEEGPGGPILVIVNGSYGARNPFGNYLGEILRAEGLAAFKKIELTLLMREPDPLSFLDTFKLVLLAETRLLPDSNCSCATTFPAAAT